MYVIQMHSPKKAESNYVHCNQAFDSSYQDIGLAYYVIMAGELVFYRVKPAAARRGTMVAHDDTAQCIR